MSEAAIGYAAVDGPVLVIGTGLIGTSIALALSRAGVDVALEDADASALQEAVYRGAGSVLTDHEPSIVIVAVPPAVAASQMADASRRFGTATITDTTSVKGHILDEAIRLGADHERLVGGHPMAGREISGPSAARADLFDDRLWIMTPTGHEGEEHLARTRRLITTCGAAVEVMDPAEHDMAVAVVSHAPQVLASAMASLLTREPAERIKIAGQGLADTTRIAASDTDLWMQILAANAGPVSGVLTSLVEQINRALSSMAPEAETAGLEDVLDQGNLGHSRLPGKHGAAATRYAVVPVMVKDEPGELARLFVAAGDLDVNLEDVRIEHVLGRPSGLVDLFVQPAVRDALVEGLERAGFDVRT